MTVTFLGCHLGLFNEKSAATTVVNAATKLIPRLGSLAKTVTTPAARAVTALRSAPQPARGVAGALQSVAPKLNLAGRSQVAGGEATAFLGADDVIKMMRPNRAGGEGMRLLPQQFSRQPGRLPTYNIQAEKNPGLFSEIMPLRNMVPGMPQMTNVGRHFNSTIIQQPRVYGTEPSFRAMRQWMRDNKIIPVRKGEGSVSAGAYSSTHRYVPARAGVARVPDKPWLGFIPRDSYLLMDDIKPGNLMQTAGGKVVPIDVMAAKLGELQALRHVPQFRNEFARRVGGYAGLGGVGAGGILANNHLNR